MNEKKWNSGLKNIKDSQNLCLNILVSPYLKQQPVAEVSYILQNTQFVWDINLHLTGTALNV